jgi:antitoxin HicB
MAMDFYFEDKRPVPAPSKMHEGEELVALPASLSAKVTMLFSVDLAKVATTR